MRVRSTYAIVGTILAAAGIGLIVSLVSGLLALEEPRYNGVLALGVAAIALGLTALVGSLLTSSQSGGARAARAAPLTATSTTFDQYCELFKQCTDLDGRLLINRTIEGPSLAIDEAEFPFGSLSMKGASLHTYFDLNYAQSWIAKEACYAPVRSVMGLAPGETVTIEVLDRQELDFVNLVQNGMQSADVSSHTDRTGNETIDSTTVEMSPASGEFGSWLEAAAGAVGGGIQAGVRFGDSLIDTAQKGVDGIFGIGESGGGGGGGPTSHSVHSQTSDAISETLDNIQHSQSQQTLTQTTTSRSTITQRTVTHTFTNPYRDRSLEIRFIPVFRRFEVNTQPSQVTFGLSLRAGPINFAGADIGAKVGDFIQRRAIDPRIVSVATAELGFDPDLASGMRSGTVNTHLNANANLYTKRFLPYAHAQRDTELLAAPVLRLLEAAGQASSAQGSGASGGGGGGAPESARTMQMTGTITGGNVMQALTWSRMRVRDNRIYVPLAPPETVQKALSLNEDQHRRLREPLQLLSSPTFLSQFASKKSVHLFMGTHIEVVPGACILPDVPEPLPKEDEE
jgi:hypothetical protein